MLGINQRGIEKAALVLSAIEESVIDLLINSEPKIAPMTIEAWLILAVMLGRVAWGFLAERCG